MFVSLRRCPVGVRFNAPLVVEPCQLLRKFRCQRSKSQMLTQTVTRDAATAAFVSVCAWFDFPLSLCAAAAGACRPPADSATDSDD